MNVNRTLVLAVLSIALLSSCVSKKSFEALEAEKNVLAMQMEKLQADFKASEMAMQEELTAIKETNSSLEKDKMTLSSDLEKTKGDFTSKLSQVQASVDDKQNQLDALKGEINAAFADVEAAVSSSSAKINEIENFLYLDLSDDLNFRSGSNSINPNDTETLEMLANMLKSNPKVAMIIEGHTDSRSIANEKYQDNWDLSVSRATTVVRKLVKMGVNPEQLVASGRSEFMPSDNNETKEGRENNRRTEAILVPNIGKLYKLNTSGK